jgi:hypothetical protein
VQPGFHFSEAQATAVGLGGLTAAQRVGQCVPWLHAENPATTIADGSVRVYPVDYQVTWPPLPALLTVGETVYERSKNGISGVATQLAVTKIYDDEAPGVWNDAQQKIGRVGRRGGAFAGRTDRPAERGACAVADHLRRQPQPADHDQE